MLLTSLTSDIAGQTKRVLDLTKRIHDSLDGSLSPETGAFNEDFPEQWKRLPWKRYQYFYGVLVPVIIHDALFRLHRTPITKTNQKVVSAQALVTGLFDDLFDRIHLPAARIRQLMNTPEYILSSDHIEEYLCQYLYREIHQHFQGSSRVLEKSIQAIMNAQEISSRQRNPDVSIDEVLKITRKKGGNAVLFYRSCIDRPMTEEEKAFLYELGGLFQMTNDINDALKDHQSGERTFMTFGLTLHEIHEIFRSQIRQTFESRKALSSEKYHKKGFFRRINILLARSLVALDRYNRLSDPSLPFDIDNIPPNRVISGLMIPYELINWFQHYTSLDDD